MHNDHGAFSLAKPTSMASSATVWDIRDDGILTRMVQVLAVDLLNPTPQAEARKHKLKVCHAIISPPSLQPASV